MMSTRGRQRTFGRATHHSPWYLWKYKWKAPDNPGEVEISARAIANDGLTQKEAGFDADPAGAVGYHFVRAEIVKG